MEDNEFEEVTIISHTDHGTSVLPQSTAERLMKEIKLEVTQKISQNENVKLGSLQHSTTPTLLDSIYQSLPSGREGASVHFLGPMLDFHDRFCFGVGVGSSYLALRGLNSSDFPRAPKGLNRDVHYAIWWGPNLFVFQSHADVKVYDLNYQEVQLTGSLRTYNGSPAWG